LFNHESPRRGETFVTRKITIGVAKWKRDNSHVIRLGNLDAVRDWGFAGEYIGAMHLMLQRDNPGDYVIATGKGSTVREFVEKSFGCIDVEIYWEGNGFSEVGLHAKTKKKLVVVDSRYFRPSEVDILIGDASLAEKELEWKARIELDELCAMMVKSDIEYVKR